MGHSGCVPAARRAGKPERGARADRARRRAGHAWLWARHVHGALQRCRCAARSLRPSPTLSLCSATVFLQELELILYDALENKMKVGASRACRAWRVLQRGPARSGVSPWVRLLPRPSLHRCCAGRRRAGVVAHRLLCLVICAAGHASGGHDQQVVPGAQGRSVPFIRCILQRAAAGSSVRCILQAVATTNLAATVCVGCKGSCSTMCVCVWGGVETGAFSTAAFQGHQVCCEVTAHTLARAEWFKLAACSCPSAFAVCVALA